MPFYSRRELARRFGLPAATIRALAQDGHITADSGQRVRYTFQDLLVLRLTGALSAAKIPLAKIRAALGNIRTALPGAALTALSVQPIDADDGVRAAVFRAGPRRPATPAQRHFQRGAALEREDPAAARAVYMDSLAADVHHVEARINLGRLLHLNGEHAAAEKIYRAGLTANAVLSFNLALLLEDLDRESEAILAYREALAHDPRMEDAHFNLARLHQRAGKTQDAFRHLLSYRRLSKKFSDSQYLPRP